MLIVDSQLGQSTIIGNQLQSACDRGVIVDGLTLRGFFCEEDALMISDCTGERFVCERCINETGAVEPRNVMPMAREAVAATELALSAENVDCCGFFPEGAFGAHDLWRRGRKLYLLQICGRVTTYRALLAGLAGRAGTELQHDGGRHISGSGGQRCVFDEYFVTLGPHGGR